MSCAARAFAIAAALTGLPGLVAAELCVLPLEGGGPGSAVEAEHPWRMVFEVASIPGYPLPLIWPQQRDELYTIRGMRFEPLGAVYPALQFFQWRSFAQRRDGTIIGFGQMPDQLWVLRPGEAEFSLLPDMPPYRTAGYDKAEDRVYIEALNGDLYELQDEKAVLSALTGLPSASNGALPRYVEELGGYLAATEAALWYRPSGAGQWQELADTAYGGLYSLTDARIFSLGRNTVAIGLRRGVVVLRAGPGLAPEVVYSLPWTSLPPLVGGSIATWRPVDDPREGPRDFALLTPDGPVTPPGDPVPRAGDRLSVFAKVAPDHSFMLVENGNEIFVFDGARIIRRPDLDADRIGSYPQFLEMAGKTFLRTSTGWFSVAPGLKLAPAPLPFPVRDLGDNLLTVPLLGGTLLLDGRGNKLWFTGDGVTFEPVQNRTGAPVEVIGGALAERAAAIVVTEAGAAIVEACAN